MQIPEIILQNMQYIKPVLTFLVALFIYIIVKNLLRQTLRKRVKSKRMTHNITIFINILTYSFVFITILFITLSITGDLLSIGITAGLLTAALGWALQRPITGIAAWIMVVFAKPFEIGDRIIIGGVKGDVVNITLTHIYLKEFGGTVGGEETSGRVIMIPNSVLFEKDVINYTFQDDYILDEISVSVTYESEIEKAKTICINAAKKITKDFLERAPRHPYLRLNFQPSGVDIRVRYYTPAGKRQEYNSNITEEILKDITKTKGVEIAYPHSEILFRKK